MARKKVLSSSVKYKAVTEALLGELSLVAVARKYQVSRQSLYFWINEFKKSKKKTSECLKNHYRRGSIHPKSIGWKKEKEILDLIIKNPGWGLSTLGKKLKEKGFDISLHGIYNVLVRHELQTKELRERFSKKHPIKTILAPAISADDRVKIIEQYLKDGKQIAKICKEWGISRPTFYKWMRTYEEETKRQRARGVKFIEQEGIIKSLARRYRKGKDHYKSLSEEAKEAVLTMVRNNPSLSVHKIYEQIPKVLGKALVGHHGIQNILSRENLSTLAARLIFVQGFSGFERVAVAPLYKPEIPVYSWRDLLIHFKNLKAQIISQPKAAFKLPLYLAPIFIIFFWLKMIITTNEASAVGLFFASIALFFGFFFFVYSVKYYVSILMILKVTQSSGVVSEAST